MTFFGNNSKNEGTWPGAHFHHFHHKLSTEPRIKYLCFIYSTTWILIVIVFFQYAISTTAFVRKLQLYEKFLEKEFLKLHGNNNNNQNENQNEIQQVNETEEEGLLDLNLIMLPQEEVQNNNQIIKPQTEIILPFMGRTSLQESQQQIYNIRENYDYNQKVSRNHQRMIVNHFQLTNNQVADFFDKNDFEIYVENVAEFHSGSNKKCKGFVWRIKGNESELREGATRHFCLGFDRRIHSGAQVNSDKINQLRNVENLENETEMNEQNKENETEMNDQNQENETEIAENEETVITSTDQELKNNAHYIYKKLGKLLEENYADGEETLEQKYVYQKIKRKRKRNTKIKINRKKKKMNEIEEFENDLALDLSESEFTTEEDFLNSMYEQSEAEDSEYFPGEEY